MASRLSRAGWAQSVATVSPTSFGMKMKANPGDRGEGGVRAGAGERALGCGSPYFCRTCPSTGGGLHGG